MDCGEGMAAADAEKWRNAIFNMVQEINNTDYLRRIYFFSKVKHDREKEHSERRQESTCIYAIDVGAIMTPEK